MSGEMCHMAAIFRFCFDLTPIKKAWKKELNISGAIQRTDSFSSIFGNMSSN